MKLTPDPPSGVWTRTGPISDSTGVASVNAPLGDVIGAPSAFTRPTLSISRPRKPLRKRSPLSKTKRIRTLLCPAAPFKAKE